MRTAKMTIILGFNGTGKTSLLEKILLQSPEKTLVVTPDDIEWKNYELTELDSKDSFLYKGIKRHIFDPSKKGGTLDKISHFKRGTLVFDDCRSYLHASTHDSIRQLIIRRRQRMVDVFVVGHGFTEVPPVFFTFATDIILFRTEDNIERRKPYIKNFEEMKKAQDEVNRKAKQNPHYCKIIPIETL